MPGKTYVYRNGRLVEKARAERLASRVSGVISDSMNATQHMANGKMTESKSEFRRWTKDAGCVEVGNSPLAPRKMPQRPRAGPYIARAIEQLTSR